MRIQFKSIEYFARIMFLHGYNQSKLSLKIGKCRQYMSNALATNTISPDASKKICELFNKEFDDFFLIKLSTKVNNT